MLYSDIASYVIYVASLLAKFNTGLLKFFFIVCTMVHVFLYRLSSKVILSDYKVTFQLKQREFRINPAYFIFLKQSQLRQKLLLICVEGQPILNVPCFVCTITLQSGKILNKKLYPMGTIQEDQNNH